MNRDKLRNCGTALINLGRAFHTLSEEASATSSDVFRPYIEELEMTLIRLRQATGVH